VSLEKGDVAVKRQSFEIELRGAAKGGMVFGR